MRPTNCTRHSVNTVQTKLHEIHTSDNSQALVKYASSPKHATLTMTLLPALNSFEFVFKILKGFATGSWMSRYKIARNLTPRSVGTNGVVSKVTLHGHTIYLTPAV